MIHFGGNGFGLHPIVEKRADSTGMDADPKKNNVTKSITQKQEEKNGNQIDDRVSPKN